MKIIHSPRAQELSRLAVLIRNPRIWDDAMQILRRLINESNVR